MGTTTRRGRPTRAAEVHREGGMEQSARRIEALSLVAALRVVANDLERIAWGEEAYGCVSQADRLRDVASRYERKWSEAGA